jgi:hypothetical protein
MTEPPNKGKYFMNTNGPVAGDVTAQSRPMPQGKPTDRATLAAIARRAMLARGLEPDFSPAAQQELATIVGPAAAVADVRDLRVLYSGRPSTTTIPAISTS